MLKRILFPTDFSSNSIQAEKLALDIAGKYHASLHLFHSVQAPVDWVKLSIDEERNYPEILEKIREARARFDEFEKKYSEIDIKTFIGFNVAGEDIIKHADDNDIDLIVIGSHGNSGFKATVPGSNTRKVLELSDVPVLVVKRKNPNISGQV